MNEQPKTKRIKDRLAAYLKLLREIDNEVERLDRLLLTYGSPPGPDLSGMPRPKGGVSNRVAVEAAKKIELEDHIKELNAEEREENRAIEAMLRQIDDPDKRAVIRLRYFDRADWNDVAFALFGTEPDYLTRSESYLRRTYKIHGRALLDLADILEREDPGEVKGSQVVVKGSKRH